MSSSENPFAVTKAADLSDQEICDLWVELPKGKAHLLDFLDMGDPTPAYILGAKGAGRTHLLRYLSYHLVRLTAMPANIIKKRGYVALYYRCTGLNAGRFHDHIRDKTQGTILFQYYFDLTLCLVFLQHLNLMLTDGICHPSIDLAPLSRELELDEELQLEQLINSIIHERRRIDRIVTNTPFENGAVDTPNLKHFVRGSIINIAAALIQRGIAHALSVPELRVVLFLDEVENFTEMQQRYIMTLLRERDPLFTIKIGARSEGIRTEVTFSAGEPNVVDSEYRVIYLDKTMRESQGYLDFARRMIMNRLHRTGADAQWIDSQFETHGDNEFSSFLRKGPGSPHSEKFERWLGQMDLPPDTKSSVLRALFSLEDGLLQKGLILHAYKALRGSDIRKLERESDAIVRRPEQLGRAQLAHHVTSLQAQLYRDYDQGARPLCGLDTIIQISAGTIRHVLSILKHMYVQCRFEGFEPFTGAAISIRLQNLAIQRVSESFFLSSVANCSQPREAELGIRRIASYLSSLRYADIPAESNPSGFMVLLDKSPPRVDEMLRECTNRSLLIMHQSNRGKNKNTKQRIYQIHPLLAPMFDFSYARRGRPELSPEVLDAAFFQSGQEGTWSAFHKNRIDAMNIASGRKQLWLFEEEDADYGSRE
jgi:hypothetical protein